MESINHTAGVGCDPFIKSQDENCGTIAAAIRDRYRGDPQSSRRAILIYGPPGVGKTSLAATARKPVLMHSFDPGGSRVDRLARLIADGAILVERFEDENYLDTNLVTSVIIRWEARFEELFKSGFFNYIGTYWLDSLTSLANMILNQHLRQAGRVYPALSSRFKIGADRIEGAGMSRDMYQYFLVVIRGIVQKCLAMLPCDFVLVGHVERATDELSGQIVKTLLVPGKSKFVLPPMFDAMLYAGVDDKGARYLQAHPQERVDAKCRFGENLRGRLPMSLAAAYQQGGVYEPDKPPLFAGAGQHA